MLYNVQSTQNVQNLINDNKNMIKTKSKHQHQRSMGDFYQ